MAIAYAPAAARAALRALWTLDARLAGILRAMRDPIVAQMRLTWWHGAVADPAGVAGEPVLAALAEAGFAAGPLRRIVEGWEALLDGDDEAALAAYADARGGGLFAAAAAVLAAGDTVAAAGAGWALADLARHHSRSDVARQALALAGARLAGAPRRWTRSARPLGMLAKLARRDLAGPERQGSPRRLAAMAALALTGR